MIRRNRVSAALLAGFLAALPLHTRADDGPAPEKRFVGQQGIDFFGGDIRSIFNTTLEACAIACRDEQQCTAFTYNLRSDACFLKSAVEKTTPFDGAVSARLVETPAKARERAQTRAGALDMIRPFEMQRARVMAETIGLRYPADAATDIDPAKAVSLAREQGRIDDVEALLGAAVGQSDAPDAWLDLSREYARLVQTEYRYRELAVAAAINGYLRSDAPGAQATALNQLARTLELDDRGRASLDVLKLSENVAPRDETRRALARARAQFGFRLVDHRIESDAASPRLCAIFSEAVAPATDFEPYIRVAGQDLPVEASDRQVCIDGLKHGERYEITLRSGLPAAAPGEKLLKDVTIETYVRDRTPSIGFAGRAYILPRTADAALPITTVNLEEVALRIHRVSDRNLMRAVQDSLFGASLNVYRENTLESEFGELVWEGVGEVERALNEDTVTRLPLGDAVETFEPGVYVATAREIGREENDWEDAATQWFVVTDLGLTTTLAGDGLHVFTRGLSDAQVRAGVAVTLLSRNNEILGEATSDAEGYVRFAPGLSRGKGGAAPAMLTARLDGGDFVFLDLTTPGFDLSDRGVEGRAAPGPVDIFVTTERGAYRPGERVHSTILARDAKADAVETLPLTVIVRRPDGVEFLRRTAEDEGAGGRAVSFDIDDTAMRGSWELAVHADAGDSALARTSFLVEDFLPQRIDFDLSAPEGPVGIEDTAAIGVEAAYLYGAPAADLPVEGEAVVKAVRTLDAFPAFLFGLEDEQTSTWFRSLEPGLQTDGAGRASIPMQMPENVRSTRPLSLTAVIRVRDGSSRPVERTLDMPLQPDAPLIGVRSLSEDTIATGEEARFEVIAIGPDGTRIDMEDAAWTLSRIDTRYQWYSLDGRWDYEPVTTRERIASGRIGIGASDPATIAQTVDWGRYELKVVSASAPGTATSVGFRAGWYAPVAGSGTPDTLEVALDRDAYAIGDTATLRIDARHGGEVIVQVLGTGLIATQTETVEKGETTLSLDVTEEWGAGAYVVATLLRPMDEAAKRNPARAMGLTWLPVDPGERHLDLTFASGDEAAPRGPLDASVAIAGLKAGETAYVTVAAVDVGVLNVTGFEPPEPDEWYFGQRALGAEMRDLYGRLIDGMQGAQGRIRSGGGALGNAAAPPPIEDLVAFFSGVVETDANGLARIGFDLPDFNGTVKLMAIAWTDTGIGSASRDVLVRDPVVVSVTAPRFLAPDDESRVLVEVAHAFGPVGDATVRLEADDALTLGIAERAFTLKEGEKIDLIIPVTAKKVGDPDIRLVATTPDGTELTKTVRLPVRANDPVVARRNRIPLAADGTFTVDEGTFTGLLPGTGRATLVVGALARFDTAGMLNGLDLYPYGCTEQTTSRALPLLYYSDVAQSLGLAPSGSEIGKRVDAAIRRILSNQSNSGSFGLWNPNGGDFWLDAYVTDFLSRAREAGYEVPERAFEAAIANLRNRVSYAGDFERGGEALAYALMVLAREGSAAIGDLRYYADAKGEALATPLAKAQLGAALALYGEQRRADTLFRMASAAPPVSSQRGWREDYGTDLRDAAGVLALGVEAGSQAIDADGLTARISQRFADKDHTSTQEKVWTLLAANALLKDGAADSIELNGQPVNGSVVELIDAQSIRGEPMEIRNTGDAPFDAVLTTFGIPTEPEAAGGNGYAITRTYYTMEGAEISPETVAQNTRLVVVLGVTSTRNAQARLMVDDALPAGFEIDNPGLLRSGDIASLDWLGDTAFPDHAEFRSDRFIAAVTGQETFELAYMVRAISPGTFHHPAAIVEDMYRPEFRARTAAGRVTVE